MAKTNENKLIISTILIVLTATIFIDTCSGSAIPMWEFLSRGEKMSHLYSMFAKQVSGYCKQNSDTPVAQCKRDLLMYGLGKLHEMTDTHLDSMDPYQRGANDIIWDSMMSGQKGDAKTQEVTSSTETIVKKPQQQQQQFAKNPLFDDAKPSGNANQNSMDDMDLAYQFPTGAENLYSEPQNYLPQEAATNVQVQYVYSAALTGPGSSSYPTANGILSGPMVIRVRPDGTPVEEDKFKPLPRDDDREEMTLGKDRLPTIEQLEKVLDNVSNVTTKKSTTSTNYRNTERSTY